MWTGAAAFNHAFVFMGPNELMEALVKITRSPKSKYGNRTVRIYRIPLTESEQTALATGLAERENTAYGWDKYPLFIADAFASWIKRNILRQKKPCFWFTKTFHVSNIPVCSQLVVWAIHKFTSYRFRDEAGEEVNWTVVNPDYLEDLLKLPINNATMIYEQVQK